MTTTHIPPLSDDRINIKNEFRGVKEFLARLIGREDIFVSGHTLTRVILGSDGRQHLCPMVKPQELINWSDMVGVEFEKDVIGPGGVVLGQVEVFMPTGWATKVLGRGEYRGVAALAGVSQVPVARRDGSIVQVNGFDRATGWFLDLDEDLLRLEIPQTPTDADIRAASALILDTYSGFPFGNASESAPMRQASLANAVGLLMSGALKAMYPTMPIPIHVADAGAQGSGKSLVAMELPGLVNGAHAMLTFTDEEPEVRKRITTEMVGSSARILCFDNVMPGDYFESGVIAQAVTSITWNDRMLGSNTRVSVPMDRVLTATGNNIKLGPDLLDRSVPIILDPDTARPGAREFALDLSDADVLRGLRSALITAVLTIVRAWALRGCPEVTGTRIRQFSSWARRMGGVLELMNIEGHLENIDALREVSDDEHGLEILWRVLWDWSKGVPFTTAEAARVIEYRSDLDDVLPSWIADAVSRWGPGDGFMGSSATAVSRKLGYTMRNHQRRVYDGIRVVPGPLSRTKTRSWAVREVESAGDEGDPPTQLSGGAGDAGDEGDVHTLLSRK